MSARMDCTDTLDHRRLGFRNELILESDYLQPAADHLLQLAGRQQECRVGWPAVTLVACGEGFVDQRPIGRQSRQEMGK